MKLPKLVVAFAVAVVFPGAARAQSTLTGYYQSVPLWGGSSPLVAGGLSDFNRARLSTSSSFGAFSVEMAYEHVLTLRQHESTGFFIGAVPGGGEWLELQWTLAENDHVVWQHRFDRLSVGFRPISSVRVDVGRQAISWATTLFLNPADPFSPFDPADPFREFRAGVDAARLRLYPGPLSEIDVVVRPTRTAVGEELTALGRGLTTFSGWEVSGWAGLLYDELSGAGAAAGSIGPWAVRAEGVVREAGDDVVVRLSAGVDRLVSLAGRDLLVALEYQHDGLGAASAAGYTALVDSRSFLRGELQVLGRDEAVLQSSFQIHPLFQVAGLVLWNLNDASALVSPSFSYSASELASVSGGLFVGLGASGSKEGLLFASEYGVTPTTAYVSISLFF